MNFTVPGPDDEGAAFIVSLALPFPDDVEPAPGDVLRVESTTGTDAAPWQGKVEKARRLEDGQWLMKLNLQGAQELEATVIARVAPA